MPLRAMSAGLLRADVSNVRHWLHCAVAHALSKGSGGGFGDSLVLFAAPTAYADGAHYLAATL